MWLNPGQLGDDSRAALSAGTWATRWGGALESGEEGAVVKTSGTGQESPLLPHRSGLPLPKAMSRGTQR